MARILVAASPEPRAIVERILAGHELTCAETMGQAEQFLQGRTFDLIVCTIAFDESRMFDLLQFVKSRAEGRIPFVAALVRPEILPSTTARWIVAFTCGALGGEAFLDIAEYGENPERKMREAIERLLGTTPEMVRGMPQEEK